MQPAFESMERNGSPWAFSPADRANWADGLEIQTMAELAERGKGFLTKSLGRAVTKGKLSESERDEIVGRVAFGDDLAAMKDADLVIEAVPELLEIKTSIFTTLDDIVRDDCVIATNTSSLSITEIARATKVPSRVIGMHFFNPAPVQPLVEVIRSVMSDETLVEQVRELAERLGKKPVVVGDRAGFVANALLVSYLATWAVGQALAEGRRRGVAQYGG